MVSRSRFWEAYDPVKPIIGRHDGPRRSLPDRDLEAAQVNLPKRPLTDHGIDTLAVALLIVRREMLDRSPDALRLNPAHHRGAHFPRQKRIFGIVLEIPSAQRIALNIHRRGQKHVGTVFKRFVTHRVTDRLHQFGIPRSGQRGGCGESGAVIGFGRVAVPEGFHAHSGRTVAHDGRHQTEPCAIPSGTFADIPAPVVVFVADHHEHLLLRRHGGDHLVHRIAPERRSRLCGRKNKRHKQKRR